MSKSSNGISKVKRPNHRPTVDKNSDDMGSARLYLLESITDNPTIDRRTFLVTSAICMGGLLTGCESPTEPPEPPDSDPDWHELPYPVYAHFGALNCDVNPDGNSVSSFGSLPSFEPGYSIKKWEIPTAKLLDKLSVKLGIDESASLSSFNSSGELLIVSIRSSLADGDKIIIYDWASLRQISTVPMPGRVLGISRAMQAAVGNYYNGHLEIRDITTNTIIRSVPMSATGDVGLSLDGRWAFSRRENGDFDLLSVLQSEEDRILAHGNDGRMISAKFSPDNRRFVALVDKEISLDDSELIIWDLESTDSSPMATHWESRQLLLSCTFSADSKHIVAVWDRFYDRASGIDVLDTSTGNLLRATSLPYSMYSEVELSIDSTILVLKGKPSKPWFSPIIDYYDYEKSELTSNLFDAADTWTDYIGHVIKIRYYSLVNDVGQEIMYTTSYRNTLPNGSACSCDYVQGELCSDCSHCSHCSSHCGAHSCSTNWCVPVCTCVPIF